MLFRSNESGSFLVTLNDMGGFVDELDIIHRRVVGMKTWVPKQPPLCMILEPKRSWCQGGHEGIGQIRSTTDPQQTHSTFKVERASPNPSTLPPGSVKPNQRRRCRRHVPFPAHHRRGLQVMSLLASIEKLPLDFVSFSHSREILRMN